MPGKPTDYTELIAIFGGASKLGQRLGIPRQNVHAWVVRESIPVPYWGMIIYQADLVGYQLSIEDMVGMSKHKAVLKNKRPEFSS